MSEPRCLPCEQSKHYNCHRRRIIGFVMCECLTCESIYADADDDLLTNNNVEEE